MVKKREEIRKTYIAYSHHGQEQVGKLYRQTPTHTVVYNGFKFVRIPIKQNAKWHERCPHSYRPISYKVYYDQDRILRMTTKEQKAAVPDYVT